MCFWGSSEFRVQRLELGGFIMSKEGVTRRSRNNDAMVPLKGPYIPFALSGHGAA